MLLNGKVAIVSGIGPGMGRDISIGLAQHGADVVLGGRTEAKLEKVAAEVEALGRRALPVRCDVTDADSCRALTDRAVDELGQVDILVNNAFDSGNAKTLLDSDLDDWRRTMEVNLFGALAMTKAATPHLGATGDGRVVMINTMSTQRIEPRWGAYAASKGALATATKTLARELGPLGIRVNGIHPGYIYGESVEWYLNHLAEKRGVSFQDVYDEIAGETCLGYLPTSEEIAGTVVFLASPLAKPVTGQMIGVNCGHWFNG